LDTIITIPEVHPLGTYDYVVYMNPLDTVN